METFAAIDFRKRLPMTSPKSLLSGDSQIEAKNPSRSGSQLKDLLKTMRAHVERLSN
jgi:hypothetical protein